MRELPDEKCWQIPRSWGWVRLSDVVSISSNLVKPEKISNLPHIAPDNIQSGVAKLLPFKTIGEDGVISPKHHFHSGQVLYSKIRPYLRKAVLVDFEGGCSADMYPLTASIGLDARYLLSWIVSNDFTGFAVLHQGRTVLPKINQEALSHTPLPLPPLAEQKRIVAKLDALKAKSARARTELARIETLISRYKEAVLSKAFSGELVASEARDAQPIKDLVRRERESLLAGSRARNPKGAAPSPDRKPVEIGRLPGGWYVAPLEELCDPTRLIQYGILMPGPDVEGGIPYVKVMNIKSGFVELGKIRRTTQEIHKSYTRSALRQGDLLLTIRGTVGRVAITPVELEGGNITQDTVRVAVLECLSSRYIYWYLQSLKVQQYFEANKKGVAVQGINVGDVRPMEVPLAPLKEQHEIVRRIESAFAKIDQLAKEAKRALALVGRLDEAILARAFRGELVPQDDKDEPAEQLLARIRAERERAPKAKRGRGAKA